MGNVVRLEKGRPALRPDPAAARSLLRPGYNCWAVARANRAAVVVDTEAYYKALHQAVQLARHSILILAWDFNSRTRLHYDPVPPGGPPAVAGDLLNWAVRRRRGLQAHILNWDYPIVFGTDREFPPLYGFGWTPHRRVHLRYDDTHPLAGSQHQKVVVIDDALAFSGGIDITIRHWDTIEHLAEDPRRAHEGESYPPYHDVMAMVDGDAARALGDLARERWRAATGETLKPVTPDRRDRAGPAPWIDGIKPDFERVEIGIARTMPPKGEAPAIREVERLYLDMIASAKEAIYIENQYFTAPRIAAALEKRLAEPDGPQIVIVLRLLSHGWLEEHTMHVLRTRLIDKLLRADRHGKLGVYYPDVEGLQEGCCLDIHSKVMVVDDRALRIGSANVSSRSMGMDSECDLLIEARGRPEVADAIRHARNGLIAEHMGCDLAKFEQAVQETGSLHKAITSLRCSPRALKELKDLPEWSDTVVEMASVADPDEPLEQRFQSVAQFADDETGPAKPRWLALAAIAAAFAALAAIWQFTRWPGS